jgi:hypothetical protein
MKWFKKKRESDKHDLLWDPSASEAIQMAMQQAPIPKMLQGRIRKELRKAAEETARQVKSDRVLAEHVMQGMLAKMPANIRDQVQSAMQSGPSEIAKLQKKLRGS